MPNWCANRLTLTHPDSQALDAAVESFESGRFLEHFVPLPDNEWDYNFCITNWGTKWDVGGAGSEVSRLDHNTVELTFDSAWAPPIEAYRVMVNQGFDLEAFYYEPGCAFCGRVVGTGDQFDDDYREYAEHDPDDVRDFVGEELDDMWGISESIADWDDDQDEFQDQ